VVDEDGTWALEPAAKASILLTKPDTHWTSCLSYIRHRPWLKKYSREFHPQCGVVSCALSESSFARCIIGLTQYKRLVSWKPWLGLQITIVHFQSFLRPSVEVFWRVQCSCGRQITNWNPNLPIMRRNSFSRPRNFATALYFENVWST
jgi:hypothetical protein